MADRTMRHPQVFGVKEKHVTVTVYPNGTGTPTWTSADGIASVVYSTTGTWLVTLDDAYKALLGHKISMQTAAIATAAKAKLGVVSNVGTSSRVTAQVFIVNNSETGVDLAANANNSVSLTLIFEDSTALDVTH